MPVKQPDLETAFSFFNEIGIIAQLSSNEFQRSLPHDLTPAQFSVLNWFSRVDTQANPTRLATAFQVTKGAMTNTLKKLEAKGFVQVVPDESSGRSKVVTMTAAGKAARQDALKAMAPVLEAFVKAFPAKLLAGQLPELRNIRRYLDVARYED